MNKLIFLITLSCVIFICVPVINALAEELVIARGESDYQPYEYLEEDNKTVTGITPELINEAALMLGIKITYKSYPWARAVANARTGKVDGIMQIFKTQERIKFLYFPDTEIGFEETAFFTHKQSEVKYSGNIQDLQPYTIGSIRGFSYGSAFDSADYLKRQLAVNMLMLLKQFEANRFRVGIGEISVIKFHANKLGISHKLVFLQPSVSMDPYYLAFSKAKGKTHEELADAFSKAIRNMKSNGTYRKILKKYGVE